MVVRVDVMSLKGGAGKTTVAFRLAWAQAQHSKQPVLMVDADFAGACLGDLLEPWSEASWGATANLADLVCGRPETLVEQLEDDEQFPVYRLRVAPPTSGGLAPAKVSAPIAEPAVLFCPSHANSAAAHTHVTPTLLHALVAHESAGGWVEHVIETLVEHTRSRIGAPLGGVIVDHSPGLSALPWAELDAIRAAAEDRKELLAAGKAPDVRRALLVATPDLVDLRAWAAMLQSRVAQAAFDPIKGQTTWVVNRLPPAEEGRPNTVSGRLPPEALEEVWHQEAFDLPFDGNVAKAYRVGELVQVLAGNSSDTEIEKLRAHVFAEAR